MSDLGDISSLLKTSGLSDLNWLDVDEEDYRKLDTLPKQNLDISPDLQAAWSHQDKPATAYLEPNTGDAPRTMADLSEMHGKISSETKEKIAKVARFALMKSTDLGYLKDELNKRFDLNTLRLAKDTIKLAYSERGLIGKLYVNAEDFPNADNPKSSSAQFLRKYASGAKYVVVKPGAKTCVRAFRSPQGVDLCSVFHKEIVTEVPYTEGLATSIESYQKSAGKIIKASDKSPKDRIRDAYLAVDFKMSSAETPKPILDPSQFLKVPEAPKKVHLKVLAPNPVDTLMETSLGVLAGDITAEQAESTYQKTAFDRKASQVTSLLRREMLKGLGEVELIQSLKVSFSVEDLKSTKAVWGPVFKEAGLFGTVYSTQEAFDDCQEGSNFISKFNPTLKGIVAGSKCDGCTYNKMSKCAVYNKPLVGNAAELLTTSMVGSVIKDYRMAGKLSSDAAKNSWGQNPTESLRNIYKTASVAPKSNTRLDVFKLFTGTQQGHFTSDLTRRDIVKTASKYMNEGLYGVQLLEALGKRFDQRDIKASARDLKVILAEQGLQGIYYVDPSVYSDYGKGCDEVERLHRSGMIPYLKASSACGSCVHQRQAGWCSKVNKSLVDEVPYIDKVAQQREILASGESTKISYADLINNGATAVQEYQIGASGMGIDLNDIPDNSLSIEVMAGQKRRV